jgi:NAD/NADP transhydrogenase alpha subunit
MDYILDRLQEPSTYAGIAAFLAGLGLLGLNEQAWNQVLGACVTIAASAAMLLKEKAAASGAASGVKK